VSTAPSASSDDSGVVRRLTHAKGPNFSVGFRFLSARKRRAVYAAYAICRIADDIVDEVAPAAGTDTARRELDEFEQEVAAAYEGRASTPATRALVDSLEHYPIPKQAFLGLIEGCRWDLTRRRYATWDELEGYCELVAVTISDISLAIFGIVDPEAPLRGRSLAMALQLTNICRDVGEDTERDRVYLPLADLERFRVPDQQLYDRRSTPAFDELMAFEVERTRAYYRDANPLPAMVEPDARLAVRLMGTIYVRILDRIAADPAAVLHRRVALGAAGRIGVVLSGLLRRPFV
jgi:phytoene synthase